jgi:hypothetical protein
MDPYMFTYHPPLPLSRTWQTSEGFDIHISSLLLFLLDPQIMAHNILNLLFRPLPNNPNFPSVVCKSSLRLAGSNLPPSSKNALLHFSGTFLFTILSTPGQTILYPLAIESYSPYSLPDGLDVHIRNIIQIYLR